MAALLKKEQCQKNEEVEFFSLSNLVNLDIEIDEMKELLKLKETEREVILSSLIHKGITHEGDWSLKKNVRTRDTVIVEEVEKKFPAVFKKLAKIAISVTDLKKALREDEIKDVITTKAYVSYETVFDPYGKEA